MNYRLPFLASPVAAFCLILLPGRLDAAQPLRVLMVTGGCCHDYEQQKKILSAGISARANVTFTVVHEQPDDRMHKVSIYARNDWARGYDLILHNECFGAVDDVAFVETITAAHKAGMPAVMLHCSSHSYRAPATDEWRQCVGITSMKHEKRRDLKVKTVDGTHPVMKGFPAGWVDKDDELYMNVKVWPTVVPLAKAYGQDSKQDHVIIWLNTYGKARVFATTMGHQNTTMSDPVYLDLVARGLLWACG